MLRDTLISRTLLAALAALLMSVSARGETACFSTKGGRGGALAAGVAGIVRLGLGPGRGEAGEAPGGLRDGAASATVCSGGLGA